MRYHTRIRKRSTLLVIIVSVISTTVLISAIIFGVVHFINKSQVLPKQVLDAANFNLYMPAQDTKDPSAWNFVTSSANFDKTNAVVSSKYKQKSTQTVIILTQQASPDAFTDVPQQYSRLLNSLNEYAELQTSIGTIALTHPKELNGGQTTLLNTNGTLIFAKPSKSLTNDQWKQFFEDVRIIR